MVLTEAAAAEAPPGVSTEQFRRLKAFLLNKVIETKLLTKFYKSYKRNYNRGFVNGGSVILHRNGCRTVEGQKHHISVFGPVGEG